MSTQLVTPAAAAHPEWHLWVTAGTIVAVGCVLVAGVAADLAMLLALVVLLALGILTTGQAASGFANEALLTVAALYIVAAGLQRTGAVRWVAGGLLSPAPSPRSALVRMCPPIAGISAFINSTPLVAFMIPVVQDWARKSRIPASKLMIPLSYAAILGGTITLIGTSTNLVVAGLVEGTLGNTGKPIEGLRSIGFFELAPVGLPLAIAGLTYIIVLGPKLLPSRSAVLSANEEDARRYTVCAYIAPGEALDGRTIQQAGLRQMVGLFVVELVRNGEAIPAPGPNQVLRGGDMVVFAGVVESVAELRQLRGLDLRGDHADRDERPGSNDGPTRAGTQSDSAQSSDAEPDSARPVSTSAPAPAPHQPGNRLVEAVVSDTFPGLGETIRDFGFRRRYDAAVIAVARNGERVLGRIGDVSLQPGDTLLLDADPSFLDRNRNSRDFYLVGALRGDAGAPNHSRAWVAVLILCGMAGAAAWSGNMMIPSFVAAALMLVTRCVGISDARSSLDATTLLTIAASLGVSRAIETTGLGSLVGGSIVQAGGGHPIMALIAVYGATMLFTSFASNAAAAAIMFPIALGTAVGVGGDPMPFVLAVLFAASADFATPIGYQTNLMVSGPGGYRFTDYLRFGSPLNLLAWTVTVVMLVLVYGVGAT